jgi:hypothetical protein
VGDVRMGALSFPFLWSPLSPRLRALRVSVCSVLCLSPMTACLPRSALLQKDTARVPDGVFGQ